MNIDERCYGYEPANSQLRELRDELHSLKALEMNHEGACVRQAKEIEMLKRQGYVLAMRLLQSDLALDDEEIIARNTFLPRSKPKEVTS